MDVRGRDSRIFNYPPLTSKLIGAANSSPNFATTVNIAGFQLVNAAGAWIGPSVLSFGFKISVLPAIGVILALAAAALLWGANRASTSCVRDGGNAECKQPA